MKKVKSLTTIRTTTAFADANVAVAAHQRMIGVRRPMEFTTSFSSSFSSVAASTSSSHQNKNQPPDYGRGILMGLPRMHWPVPVSSSSSERKEYSHKGGDGPSDTGIQKMADELTNDKLEIISTNIVALNKFIEDSTIVINAWYDVKEKIIERDTMVELRGTAKSYLKKANERAVQTKIQDAARVAPIDFEMNEDYGGSNDLRKFTDRIDELFTWHQNNNHDAENPYAAPYFPIIQSSGMGKTKLMFEFKKSQEKKKKYKAILILCNELGSDVPKQSIYDRILTVPIGKSLNDRDNIKKQLLKWKEEYRHEKLVLLFDEAHFLLKQNAFPFRCVRHWLRETSNTRNASVAAVFAGTNSSLANFYNEPPLISGSSRGPAEATFFNCALKQYKPLYDLCTVGCCKDHGSTPRETDFDKAVPYGRPLFTLMQRKDSLKAAMPAILKRMLLSQSPSQWTSNIPALLSILATRFQMGQTAASIVSTLVSNGYGNLTSFTLLETGKDEHNHGIAEFCYFTDPVCSRLAMCLMDKDWNIGNIMKDVETTPSGEEYLGQSPSFWTEKAMEIFGNGICRPSKGDLGEVASAMYLLFCGDLIRKRIDPTYTTFSISFADWLSVLKDPISKIKELQDQNTTYEHKAGATDEVSFVQFRRLYSRLPLVKMLTQVFLKHLYLSGTACYLYEGHVAFDLVASMKSKEGSGDLYKPLFISVKARSKFDATDIKKAFTGMETAAKGIDDGAVFMLVLAGREIPRKIKLPADTEFQKLVVVPLNDPFGVSNLVLKTTEQNELSEIYSSHDFLQALHPGNDDDDIDGFIKDCLRKAAPTKTAQQYLRYHVISDIPA
jgi:Bacterial TniB protein